MSAILDAKLSMSMPSRTPSPSTSLTMSWSPPLTTSCLPPGLRSLPGFNSMYSESVSGSWSNLTSACPSYGYSLSPRGRVPPRWIDRHRPVEGSGDLDRSVMQNHQLSGAQAQGSVGVPIVIAKLDLEHPGGEVLHYGANLPPVQTLIRKIVGQCHDI